MNLLLLFGGALSKRTVLPFSTHCFPKYHSGSDNLDYSALEKGLPSASESALPENKSKYLHSSKFKCI